VSDSKLPERLANKLAAGQRITITVEYSCLDKVQQENMTTLRRWHDEGIVELQGTEAMIIEFEKTSPGVRARLEEQFLGLTKLRPEFGTELGHWALGVGALGMATTLRNGKDALDYHSEFQQIMFPKGYRTENDFYDVMHISIHYLFGRDIFITKNLKDFKVGKLRQKFNGLVILTPAECVDVLNKWCSRYP